MYSNSRIIYIFQQMMECIKYLFNFNEIIFEIILFICGNDAAS